MLRFLRENWLWILIPFSAVLGVLILLILTADAGDSVSPHIYSVF